MEKSWIPHSKKPYMTRTIVQLSKESQQKLTIKRITNRCLILSKALSSKNKFVIKKSTATPLGCKHKNAKWHARRSMSFIHPNPRIWMGHETQDPETLNLVGLYRPRAEKRISTKAYTKKDCQEIVTTTNRSPNCATHKPKRAGEVLPDHKSRGPGQHFPKSKHGSQGPLIRSPGGLRPWIWDREGLGYKRVWDPPNPGTKV